MEFNQTLAIRQSTRVFSTEQITKEQVQNLLKAANAAPTCMGNYDKVHLTVVQNQDVLRKINKAFQEAVGDDQLIVTYGAPTVIYVSNSLEDEEVVAGCNAGVIMENMLLAAADQGLAAVYLFGVSQVLLANEEVKTLLKLPEGFRTVSAIAVGYPVEKLLEREMTTEKISVDYI